MSSSDVCVTLTTYSAKNAHTPYLSVFSPNAGKYGSEKFQIWTLFTQRYLNSVKKYVHLTCTWQKFQTHSFFKDYHQSDNETTKASNEYKMTVTHIMGPYNGNIMGVTHFLPFSPKMLCKLYIS